MKKRTFKSVLSLFLSLVMLALPLGVLADEQATPSGTSQNVALVSGEMGLMYTYISSITATCYIESGKVQMGGTVSAQGHTGSCKVTLTLQKNTGGGWVADGTWSATGSGTVTKYASKTASAGALYRLKATGTVTVGSKTETDTIYTKACAM